MTQTPRIILYTVPHTGTNFVASFFKHLGLESPDHWFRYHTARCHPDNLHKSAFRITGVRALEAEKLIVTARDPYLSAIRWIGDSDYEEDSGDRRTPQQMAWSWGHMFDVLKKRDDYFIVDIGCRQSDRLELLREAADYMEIDYNMADIESFAEAWKPQNSSDTGPKQAYLRDGTLPDGDWHYLDDAVAWYKSLPTNDFDK